ncbi:carotenoid cleavage dioxygenase [Dactylonectria macrodidyma]|uniref:Carotenoid cleavage dioxygenase n=1 Tax=Dactylonectria macrodidyma TaxID=307937 RepID=A0A9P9J3P0_9HYPO|nr:carotenoid cleavage dioxygenase [Dactylonectria macrodidyma]
MTFSSIESKPKGVQSFSLDRQQPVPLDQEEKRMLDGLDVEKFNRQTVYNVPGYKPVHKELSHAPVKVTGTLPQGFEGVYLRNGTNIQFNPTSVRVHAFVGAGMIHQIQINNGEATYSNFFVRTPRFELERKIGREIFVEFSDIAGAGKHALEKIRLLQTKVKKGLIPELSNYELTPGSTSIRHHSGRIYCLQETGYAFVLQTRLDQSGRLLLDGRGQLETWDGEWEGPFSAHPRFDPISGDMYNLSIDSKSSSILAGRISQGLRHSQASFPHKGGQMSWLHDFFLTKNYIVFPDISMRQDGLGLTKDIGSVFAFDLNYTMRWGVISRNFKEGDQVQYFTTNNAGSIWHVINGWEETGPNGTRQIVLFSPVFNDYPSDVPIHTPEEPHAKVKTWTLNLDGGEVVKEELLLDHHYERPSLNLDYVGSKSRYCYLLDEQVDGYMGKGVLKYDLLDKKEVAYFSYGDMYGGEALFVPRAGGLAEDDGYLLDLLISDDRAELIIIDAHKMVEIARLHLPQRVPFGVHATWLTSDEVSSLEIAK